MWLAIRTQRQFWIAAIAVGLFTGTAVAAFGLAVRYTLREWDVLAEARADLAGDEAVRRGVGLANEALEKSAADRALLESSFADPENPLPFIESIEALARRIGVRGELTLASGNTIPADKYQINAEGEFGRVMAFLRSLESLPFLITLGDTRIFRADPVTGSVRLTVTVALVPGPTRATPR